jgi:replicative DNA helicase
VSSVKLRAGGIQQNEWSRLMDAFAEITDMPLLIENPKDNDFDGLRRKIRRAKRERKIDVVIIDYLQLLSRKGDFNRRKDLEIGSITRDLKLLANDLEIPVLLLSQLNRKVEERSSKEPVLSDLRESGAIEQDADMILFLHRADAYLKEGGQPDGLGDLIIAKHRHGPTGRIKMVWHEETASYRNFIDPQQHNQQRGE